MLTVLLATHNGARTLPDVLKALERLERPEEGWKLVVVDNGSVDDTHDILAAFENRLPLTYVYEATRGKNSALNAGLKFIAGDLIVLTDDDAFPRPDWLIQLRAAADRHPEFATFGGVVLPRWETPPPAWLLRQVPLAPTYTVSDPGLSEGEIEAHHVFGPNMAIRADVFAAGHQFDPTIGPLRSSGYAMGSETEFVLRLEKQGLRAWHVTTAVVEHFVATERMQPRWIFKRAFRFGRGQCRLESDAPPGPPFLVYQLLRKSVSVSFALLSLSRERLFRSLWSWSYTLGYTREAFGSIGRRRAG